MAKLACFLLFLLAASAAFEVLATTEGGNEVPKIEMPRKTLPKTEVITTIIESFGNTQNLRSALKGNLLLGFNAECERPQICPLIYIFAAYMTCPSSGHQHLKPAPNCCMAPEEGCKLHNADGTVICTATCP